jgi:hypothetical protein
MKKTKNTSKDMALGVSKAGKEVPVQDVSLLSCLHMCVRSPCQQEAIPELSQAENTQIALSRQACDSDFPITYRLAYLS